jgi:trehalose-phosphatase
VSSPALEALTERALARERLWLLLDYDGTLADFAPAPDMVRPDPGIAGRIGRLAASPRVRLAIVSGRRLRDVRALIPVEGIYLAGTYGVEVRAPDGKLMSRVDHSAIRPALERVKPQWADLVDGRGGFYIEDKDWALALHARFSEEDEAGRVLALARGVLERELPEAQFRILGGHRFLEAAPRLADKGKTVDFLLENYPLPDAQPVYVGDDDKDEEAFEAIARHGGVAIKVMNGAQRRAASRAAFTLDSPAAVNAWLEELAGRLEAS